MENSLRANPLDMREQYEKQLKDLQEAYGEAMLELHARKAAGPHGAGGRQLIRTLHEGLLADGIAVAADQALRLVRRSATNGLLQAVQGGTEGRSSLCRAHQEDDREGTLLRLSHGGVAAGLQQEHRAADLPDQGLAGQETGCRHAPTYPSRAFCRRGTE